MASVDNRILLVAGVATDPGTWIYAGDFQWPVTVDVVGIVATDIVQIFGSNAQVKPVDPVDARKIGADITADGMVSVAGPMRWLKAKRSANAGAGSVSATLCAQIERD